MNFIVICMILCASFITSTSGIYSDEAGVRDWSVENYGEVTDAILSVSTVYVGSMSGVTAALDTKDGSMMWRIVAGTKKSYVESNTLENHNLPFDTSNNVGIQSLLLSPNGLRLFSLSGNTLRCINTKSGRVIWDAPIDVTNMNTNTAIVYNDDDNTVIYLDTNHSITARSAASGGVVWKWDAPEKHFAHGITVNEGTLWVVLVAMDGSTTISATIAGKEEESDIGIVLCSTNCSAPVLTMTTEDEPVLICLSNNNSDDSDGVRIINLILKSVDDDDEVEALSTLKNSIQVTETSSLLPATATTATTTTTIISGVELTQDMILRFDVMDGEENDIQSLLLSILDDGSIYISPSSILSEAIVVKGRPLSIISVDTAAITLTTMGVNAESSMIHTPSSTSSSITVGKAIAAFGTKRDDQILLVTSCGLIQFINISKSDNVGHMIIWSSNQSLASVIQAKIILREEKVEDDIIQSDRLDLSTFTLDTWKLRLVSQVESIVSSFLSLKSLLHPPRATESENAGSNAALFGFHQTIVVVSSTGRASGIASETGELVWTTWLGSDVFKLHQVGKHDILFIGQYSAEIRNAHTGDLLWGPEPVSPSIVIPLSSNFHNVTQVFKPTLIMNTDSSVDTSTPTTTTTTTTSCKTIPTSFDMTDDEKELLHWIDRSDDGMSMTSKTFPPSGSSSSNVPITLWSKSFSEPIVKVGSRQSEEVVAVRAIKLGDNGILLKYLNANLISVATGSSSTTSAGVTGGVDVYLIDGISGNVIHYVTIQDALSDSIRLEMFENWVIVSYFNNRAKRSEILSITLHNGYLKKFDLNPVKKFPSILKSMSTDSYEIPSPVVFSKTFVAPGDITSMRVTVTRSGISSRHLLLGLASDAVLGLDLRWLDPRRPNEKPNASQKIEMLMQYSPIVPLVSSNLLSYNLTVFNINGIAVSPTLLESTCNVFVYGLDLFYTRYMPSKGFDLLPDSFNKPLLLILVIGMSCALMFVRNAYNRKVLATAWL